MVTECPSQYGTQGQKKCKSFLLEKSDTALSDLCTDYFPMIAIGARCKQCDVAITTATPPQWQMVLLRAMLEKHGGQAEFQRDEYCI